jgi:hypothetical protein
LDWMACGLELFSVMTSVAWSDVIPFARAQRCQKSFPVFHGFLSGPFSLRASRGMLSGVDGSSHA